MEGAYNLPKEMFEEEQQLILCCECGVQIPPNAANMCVNCIRGHVDITEGIPKNVLIGHCKGCERYANPPRGWVTAQLESRDLLTLCLKRLTGLNKVRLVDAGFIWTEPHSKRIKVRVSIQKEVFSGAILQQDFVVEYVVKNEFCPDCHRTEASNTWAASVQVRQKVKHKKTFYHLEQLIIKHKVHQKTNRITSVQDGVDFYFNSQHDAKHFINFLESVVPMKLKTSQRLQSQDLQSNIYSYKHTYCAEIVPICKDDIVCFSPKIAKKFSRLSPVCICERVGNTIHFLDPFSLQRAEVPSNLYWQYPFQTISGHGSLVEFIVLDIEPILTSEGEEVAVGKHLLCDFTVMRAKDSQEFITRSHLGRILQYGDAVWGFDFTSANINDDNFDMLDHRELPDVILIKKSYAEKRKKKKSRPWRLRTLPKEEGLLRKGDEAKVAADLEEFMNDIEEDREYRQNFELYKNPEYQADGQSEFGDEDDAHLRIGLDEMVDGMEGMGMMDDAQDEIE
eukprot:m.13150 g.13150  ORF g.13150 m.13150 type:complete len:508 (+) comp4114_c1_seq1:110-1633(+)